MDQATSKISSIQDNPIIEDQLAKIFNGFKGRPDELIPMLQAVQEVWGFLPKPVFPEIARLLKLSVAEVLVQPHFIPNSDFNRQGNILSESVVEPTVMSMDPTGF